MIDLLRRRMEMLKHDEIIIDARKGGVSGDAANDAALMRVIYAQGWSKSPLYMTKREAEAIMDIGVAFKKNASIVNFDAFQYFTSVTSINEAFSYCSILSSIVVPESVIDFGQYTFTSCGSLSKVNIPSRVKALSNQNFYGCSSLQHIELPNGLTTIGYAAFSNSGLVSIYLPKSVSSLNNNIFSGCENLTTITAEEGGTYTAVDNNIIIAKTMTLFLSSSNYIPEGVKVIGSNCFAGRGIETIDIITTVEGIEGNAFNGCKNLKAVTGMQNLKSIGYRSFYGCTSLTSVSLPSVFNSFSGQAFYNCTNLSSLILNATTPPKCYGDIINGITIIYVPEVTDKYKGLDTSVVGYSYYKTMYDNGKIKPISELPQ